MSSFKPGDKIIMISNSGYGVYPSMVNIGDVFEFVCDNAWNSISATRLSDSRYFGDLDVYCFDICDFTVEYEDVV